MRDSGTCRASPSTGMGQKESKIRGYPKGKKCTGGGGWVVDIAREGGAEERDGHTRVEKGGNARLGTEREERKVGVQHGERNG